MGVFSAFVLNFLNSSVQFALDEFFAKELPRVSAISLGVVACPLLEFRYFVGELLCLPDIFRIVFQICLELDLLFSLET